MRCEKFPPRRFGDPKKTIVYFLRDSHKQLKDIFPGVTEDSHDPCATKEEFVEKLKVIFKHIIMEQAHRYIMSRSTMSRCGKVQMYVEI